MEKNRIELENILYKPLFFFFFANGITFNKKTKQRKSHKQKRAKKASIKEKKN